MQLQRSEMLIAIKETAFSAPEERHVEYYTRYAFIFYAAPPELI